LASYLVKKLINLFIAFFITVSLTFFLMKAIPGDPFTSPQGIPKEIIDAMHRHYGLDAPLHTQYGRYLKAVLRGDLGPSFKYKDRNVSDMILSHFPVSARLGLQALALAVIWGIALGTFAAYFHKKWLDNVIMFLVTLMIAVPSFLLATVLQYFFAIKLGWLPIARWGSFAQTILPTLALSALPTVFITRLMRTSVLETLQNDYIKTAKSKGLKRRRIFFAHILPNAILPILSFLGYYVGMVLTGSFVIEKIYGIPGLGQVLIHAVNNRDYSVIMGITIFGSSLFLFTVFLSDLLIMTLDPKLRTYKMRPLNGF